VKGAAIPNGSISISMATNSFVIERYARFQDQAGKQATMFFLDPTRNALEFKAFKDIKGQLFATWVPLSQRGRSKRKRSSASPISQ
jgi:hypothetical protein